MINDLVLTQERHKEMYPTWYFQKQAWCKRCPIWKFWNIFMLYMFHTSNFISFSCTFKIFGFQVSIWIKGTGVSHQSCPNVCVGVCGCVGVGYRYIFAGYGCISPKFSMVVVYGLLQNKKMTLLFLEYSKWDTDVSKYDLPFGLG